VVDQGDIITIYILFPLPQGSATTGGVWFMQVTVMNNMLDMLVKEKYLKSKGVSWKKIQTQGGQRASQKKFCCKKKQGSEAAKGT
jgi:hypothetical protein